MAHLGTVEAGAPGQGVISASSISDEMSATPTNLYTSRDLQILHDLWLFRYLTTQQIARLHFGHLKLAQRRLRILRSRSVVDRFEPADDRFFGHCWYRLSRQGAKVLGTQTRVDAQDLMPPRRRPRTTGFLTHHEQLTDLRIWLREGCRASDGRFGYRFIPSYEEVRVAGRRRRRIALPVASRERRFLVPDGAFTLERNDARRALFLLEIDRGTEPLSGRHRSSIQGKFELYRAAFDSHGEKHYEALFDRALKGFRLLCVVPDEKRRDGFLRFAERLDMRPLVWVATNDVMAQAGDLDSKCWHTTLDGRPHALTE